jgi:hypothetical protein
VYAAAPVAAAAFRKSRRSLLGEDIRKLREGWERRTRIGMTNDPPMTHQ